MDHGPDTQQRWAEDLEWKRSVDGRFADGALQFQIIGASQEDLKHGQIELRNKIDAHMERMAPIAEAADGFRAFGRCINFFASILRPIGKFVAMCANKFRNGVLWWAPIVGLGVTIYGFATDKLHQWASSFMSNFR